MNLLVTVWSLNLKMFLLQCQLKYDVFSCRKANAVVMLEKHKTKTGVGFTIWDVKHPNICHRHEHMKGPVQTYTAQFAIWGGRYVLCIPKYSEYGIGLSPIVH